MIESDAYTLTKTFRPLIVCLCGSTRFKDAFESANVAETRVGKIVLSVGFFGTSESASARDAGLVSPELKTRLDELHLRKIDLADEVLVLNVGGYVGKSTRREAWYATRLGKTVRWLEPEKITQEEIETWFASWADWTEAGAGAAA